MYKPDRVILRKIKEYDSHLFIEWNDYYQYFELWRHMPHGRRLITPITQSIYDTKRPKVFTQLDERIIWWLYEADSWRFKSIKDSALLHDRRWLEFNKVTDKKRMSDYYDYAKDVWQHANAFYAHKYASKNEKPKFNEHKHRQKFIRPDSQSLTAPRVWGRTGGNAKAYNYKGFK